MKILLFNFNEVLTLVEDELIRRGHELLPINGDQKTYDKADVIVVWNETGIANWRNWIEQAKKDGKRVILVQHGRRGTSRIYPPFNEQLISDEVCVWSENDKKRLMSVGVPESKIHITGTPIWKNIKPRIKHDGINVVFSPEHWDVDVSENLIIADELRKLKKVNVLTKVLNGHQDPTMYQNPVVSDRNTPEHFEIVADTLAKADVVVAVSESTFELLAEALDIPVVIAKIWIPKSCDGDDRYKEYKHEYSNACVQVPLDKLNSTIQYVIKHPEHQKEERKQIAIDDGGIDIVDPIMNIINVIENV